MQLTPDPNRRAKLGKRYYGHLHIYLYMEAKGCQSWGLKLELNWYKEPENQVVLGFTMPERSNGFDFKK